MWVKSGVVIDVMIFGGLEDSGLVVMFYCAYLMINYHGVRSEATGTPSPVWQLWRVFVFDLFPLVDE